MDGMAGAAPQPFARPGDSERRVIGRAKSLTVWAKKKEIVACAFEEADLNSDQPIRRFLTEAQWEGVRAAVREALKLWGLGGLNASPAPLLRVAAGFQMQPD